MSSITSDRKIRRSERSLIERRIASLVTQTAVTACIAGAMLIPMMPSVAMAEVRTNDLVMGVSASERGFDEQTGLDIAAPYAAILDDAGNLIYARGANEQVKIASTTKIMTAHLAIKNCPDLGVRVTIGAESAGITGSSAYLKKGQTLTLHDLLLCAMLPSGNDAADAIARYVGKVIDPNTTDPMATFVDAMNAEARAIGMNDTVYRNPHGLDVDQYAGDQHSTAHDLALLARIAMADDAFREVVATPSAEIPVTNADGTDGTISLESTDTLLGNYAGALGIKTGQTQAAGSCFVGAMNDGDQTYYTVVLDDADKATAFADTQRMYDWVRAHDETFSITKGHDSRDVTLNGEAQTVPVIANVAHTEYASKTFEATVSDWTPIVTYDFLGNVSQSVSFNQVAGDVRVGDKVGEVTYMQGSHILATKELIAIEDINAPSELEKLLTAIGRFVRSMMDEPLMAESMVIEASDDADDSAFANETVDTSTSVASTMNSNVRELSTNITINETRDLSD